MVIIRGLTNLRAEHHGCVATIGNFDGLHRGHQAILARIVSLAKSLNLPSTLITFEPYPQEYFAANEALPRLTRFREKMDLLAQAGIDRVLCLHFNEQLATMPADAFIQRVLVEGLGVRHLVVGDDFRFGKQRAGDFSLLQAAGESHGFAVENTPTIQHLDRRLSSTWVREALTAGEMDLATQLLGRPYAISGRVAHGDKRGRQIGFPTANIHLRRKTVPVLGVFAVTVDGLASSAIAGVANVGNRPTVDGLRFILEVHLFDFSREIYGQHVTVNFHHRLRPEKKFNGLDELVAQITRDAQQAKNYLNETQNFNL